MSKEITVYCNRCAEQCFARFSGLEVSFGELLKHFEDAELHLCQSCGESLLSWLKAGNARNRADSMPIKQR